MNHARLSISIVGEINMDILICILDSHSSLLGWVVSGATMFMQIEASVNYVILALKAELLFNCD